MRLLLILALCSAISHGSALNCMKVLYSSKLSKNFNETVAHAVHSMTVQGLRIFTESASEHNTIPTVDHDINMPGGRKLVRDNAPDDPVGSDFRTREMNVLDKILTNLGSSNDGLGENWSPIERVAHAFHMWDLWTKIHDVYVTSGPPSRDVCHCLLDTHKNGIYKAVLWVADHYKTGTPITLLNKDITKLTDATSWAEWKERLLYYYTEAALLDAAMYLHCVAETLK